MHCSNLYSQNSGKKRLRNDVLDLYNGCLKRNDKSAEAAIKQLAAMGYHEAHPAANHWVLSRAGVKVHLYSKQELAAFAIHIGAPDAEPCGGTAIHQTLEEIS